MVVKTAAITEILIPANAGDGKVLTLRSEVTNQTYEFNIDGSVRDDGYYHAVIDFGDVPDGEYAYSIGKDRGVIRIGEYKETGKAYKKEEKHIQYNYGGI